MMKNKNLLMLSESFHNADMYYLTGFLSYDEFLYIRDNNGRSTIVVSDMELDRARRESKADEVLSFGDLGNRKGIDLITELLRRKKMEGEKLVVPTYFPAAVADKLRDKGFEIITSSEHRRIREVKTDEEVSYIKKAQRACESVMKNIIEVLKNSTVDDGLLVDERGVLTSENLRRRAEHDFIDTDCCADQMIISCGKASAVPHFAGEGFLHADEPIILDFSPRLKKERYYADMTRTVFRGEPSEDVKDMFDAVLEA